MTIGMLLAFEHMGLRVREILDQDEAYSPASVANDDRCLRYPAAHAPVEHIRPNPGGDRMSGQSIAPQAFAVPLATVEDRMRRTGIAYRWNTGELCVVWS